MQIKTVRLLTHIRLGKLNFKIQVCMPLIKKLPEYEETKARGG